MARPPSKHPTELELRILKVLWSQRPMRVRQVRQALAPGRKLAYTSVMTVMNIMVEKGYLTRRKDGPSFLYRPRVTEKATTRGMLRDLVDRAFAGSASSLMVNLLESADLDDAEIKKLRKLLNQKSGEEER